MNMLKNLKIYLLLLMTSLATLCWCQDNNNEAYDNLCTIIKEGRFAKFKNLYSSVDLSEIQKDMLIKMVDEIIELEQKAFSIAGLREINVLKWKGREIKKKIKIYDCLTSIGLLSVSVIAGVLGGIYSIEFADNIEILQGNMTQLQNGNVAIPATHTAASLAHSWNEHKKRSVYKIISATTTLSGLIGFGGFLARGLIKNRQFLISYKRFKGATKIKQFLLGSVELLKSMDPKPAHGECSEAKSNPLRVFLTFILKDIFLNHLFHRAHSSTTQSCAHYDRIF